MMRAAPKPVVVRKPRLPTGPARLFAEIDALCELKAEYHAKGQHEAANLVGCDLATGMRRIHKVLGSRSGFCCCGGAS
jgi:hypothetical protein